MTSGSRQRGSDRRPKILSVIGARPEIIQAAPLAAAFSPLVHEVLVHTGQHYDAALSQDQIFDVQLPTPDFNLGVGSRRGDEQVEAARKGILRLIAQERPDAVLVRGDTNGTLSGALAAEDAGIPLLHVEAGLRSYRPGMPEERNRVETDRRADVLFAPTPRAGKTLLDERVRGTVYVTGDPLCDVFEAMRDRVRPSAGIYLLATIHRDYNTASRERLSTVLACLARSPWPVVFPAHPRTRNAIERWALTIPANVQVVDPVPYTRMLELERGAQAIATDSGGVQREAYLWGVPCVTLREETEWTETVDTGWNAVVGVDADAFAAALERPVPSDRPPIFGDGGACRKIAALSVAFLNAVTGAAA